MKYEVQNVTITENPDLIFFLDRPAPGERRSSILEISGWTLGLRRPIERIETSSGDFRKHFPLNVIRPDVVAAFREKSRIQKLFGKEGFQFFLDLEGVRNLSEGSAFSLEIQAIEKTREGFTKTKAAVIKIRTDLDPVREPSPIFIVGSERSGTTVLRDALVNVLGIPGFGEGHLLPILGEIDSTVASYYKQFREAVKPTQDLMLNRIDQDLVIESMNRGIRELLYSIYRGARHWIDKTPGSRMIELIPKLKTLWPEAAFIFAHRRGLECVASRMRKFSHLTFEAHCQQWADCMRFWRQNKKSLKKIEIDQFNLWQDPVATSAEIIGFLGYPESHRSELSSYFMSHFPQRTSKKAGLISLDKSSWSVEQKEVFDRICGLEMEAAGYSMDENYWLDSAS